MALSNFLQHLADEVPRDDVQIINFNPGSLLTEGALGSGYTEDMQSWDSDSSPEYLHDFIQLYISQRLTIVYLLASFAVWASTKQAAFLHGRFVWANWDVQKLASWKVRFEIDRGFLKTGRQESHQWI